MVTKIVLHPKQDPKGGLNLENYPYRPDKFYVRFAIVESFKRLL